MALVGGRPFGPRQIEGAAGWPLQAGENPKESRFAATGGADDDTELAGFDGRVRHHVRASINPAAVSNERPIRVWRGWPGNDRRKDRSPVAPPEQRPQPCEPNCRRADSTIAATARPLGVGRVRTESPTPPSTYCVVDELRGVEVLVVFELAAGAEETLQFRQSLNVDLAVDGVDGFDGRCHQRGRDTRCIVSTMARLAGSRKPAPVRSRQALR